MNNKFLSEIKSSFFVKNAVFLKVGREWNDNRWDLDYSPARCHALYYRTDNSNSKAILHLIDGTLELLPDRIYFIPACSVLYSEIEGEIDKYYIHFRSDFIEFGLFRHLIEKCSVPADSMTKNLFDIVVENFDKKTEAAERKVNGAMEILMSDLLNLAMKPRDIQKFKPVLKYIEEHYREKITISALAQMMNISTIYFSSIFKKTFKMSPKQYILDKRLFEGQHLLAETDLSVREIAERVGFENANYFSEFFSAKTGMSALVFRANRKKNDA